MANQFKVVVCGSGVIRQLGVSAPYTGKIYEDRLEGMLKDGRSINFLKITDGNEVTGYLMSKEDFMNAGMSIEKALNNKGYVIDGRYVVKKETLGNLDKIKAEQEEAERIAKEKAEQDSGANIDAGKEQTEQQQHGKNHNGKKR